ncbi:MAG TPA: copper chaperone PCu(A)C [Ornithinibacter sp.]|nr:copper chaperone PCu(A)C [Ornithinibacter sp.]
MPSRTLATRRVAVLCTTFLLAGGLAACGSDSADSTGATPAASSSAVSSGLTLDDGWVKAVDAPMAGGEMSSMPSPSATASSGMDDMAGMGAMSAMFGSLRNTSDTEITITGGSSPAAGAVELHETVKNDSGQMQMQPKQGGFVVPAGGSYVLQPGGDHVMLLQLTGSLANGTSTTVTLTTSGGDVTFTVPVRSFAGAQESYVPTPSAS